MGSRHQAHRAAVTDSNMSLIQLNGVSRRYKTEGFEVTALDNVSLSIDKGEFVAIMGQSGFVANIRKTIKLLIVFERG